MGVFEFGSIKDFWLIATTTGNRKVPGLMPSWGPLLLLFPWARNFTPIASATQLLNREHIVLCKFRAQLKNSSPQLMLSSWKEMSQTKKKQLSQSVRVQVICSLYSTVVQVLKKYDDWERRTGYLRPQNDSVTSMLHYLQWPTLEYQRKTARLMLLFKIMKKLLIVPDHCLPIKAPVESTRAHHSLKLAHLQCRLDVYKYSFFYLEQ